MIVHTFHSLCLYNKKVVFSKGHSEYCAIKMPMYSFQISFFGEDTLCLTKPREKKKVLHWIATNTRLSCIYLMTIFHLNANGSQQLLQKIALCLLAPWDTIITDKTKKSVNDNSGLSPIVVSRCSVSGFFLGLYLWISLILIHVQWSLTCMKI